MGKPIRSSILEIEKCVWICSHYIENAEQLLTPKFIKTEKNKSYIVYNPLGVIFTITPWNFPFLQVFRFAIPNLLAGNAILLRHAPITTGTGLTIEQLFRAAQLPENLFRTLLIDNETAAYVIRHPHVKGLNFTGSASTGSLVGGIAASALKKSVLELGGNDPYIILADANLSCAAKACVASRMNNAGQVCIAAKRIIVVKEVYKAFEELILNELNNYKMGDPANPETNLGPLARQDIRDKVHTQVQACVKKGATLVTGGEVPNRPGFYYPLTLLKNITQDSPVMSEEIFGPIISLIEAKDEDEAINLANMTQYGLAAAIFSENVVRAEYLAVSKIRAGSCYINDLVSSDPRLPFGGINHSGFGRELGEAGIREFTNIKTIAVN